MGAIKLLISLLLAAILSSCAGSGSIKWDNVRSLREGMTKQEVEQRMGPPYSVTAKADGTEIWVWVHVNGLTMGSESASVVFKDGKASSVPKVPDSYK
jgi:hypothetical protein